MISVVVFYSLKKIQSKLEDYAVIEMGCFYDYLDAAPHAKTMRGNCITNFILHISQCITFNQTDFVTSTLIENSRLK